MEKEELHVIIKKLEANNSKEQAYFEVSYDDGEENGTYIKANKEGLQLFANELLKVSLNFEEILDRKEKTTLIDDANDWLKGLAFFNYIEIISEKPKENEVEEIKDTWQNKAVNYGCFAILIFAVIIFIVGLVSAYNYF